MLLAHFACAALLIHSGKRLAVGLVVVRSFPGVIVLVDGDPSIMLLGRMSLLLGVVQALVIIVLCPMLLPIVWLLVVLRLIGMLTLQHLGRSGREISEQGHSRVTEGSVRLAKGGSAGSSGAVCRSSFGREVQMRCLAVMDRKLVCLKGKCYVDKEWCVEAHRKGYRGQVKQCSPILDGWPWHRDAE